MRGRLVAEVANAEEAEECDALWLETHPTVIFLTWNASADPDARMTLDRAQRHESPERFRLEPAFVPLRSEVLH